ncbi:MAG: HaeIII family restriction endonuclease [Victivallales bacterium]|jgi:hypothetical protein|nr:HaeIII family restriction endonuclease [Victivallales bacterium]
MTSMANSTIMGKAYEYACLSAFKNIVMTVRPIEIINNESLQIAKGRFESISNEEQADMIKSAQAGIQLIINMEPKIVEDGNDTLTVSLQSDDVAKNYGDIRDILVIRRSIEWEIGISVKHNHAALKHSRLSGVLDFGKSWFGVPCSANYFDTIKPIFSTLAELHGKKLPWSSINDKAENIYLPLLNAFKDEFINLYEHHDVTRKLIAYLLGSNGRDYYKLIHHPHKTTVMPFNIFGTLNTKSQTHAPQIIIPPIEWPTRIIEFTFKEDSKTTLILTLNNGWSISFRIHNASSIVEASLKFDIQLQSKPENMFYTEVEW